MRATDFEKSSGAPLEKVIAVLAGIPCGAALVRCSRKALDNRASLLNLGRRAREMTRSLLSADPVRELIGKLSNATGLKL
jgi:hypothetical protein